MENEKKIPLYTPRTLCFHLAFIDNLYSSLAIPKNKSSLYYV